MSPRRTRAFLFLPEGFSSLSPFKIRGNFRMRRNWPASLYLATVTTLGLALWFGSIALARPWVHLDADVLENTGILLALTVLSAFSPIETKQGVLTVSLAPLCGAVALQLDPWAVMTSAALGTIDRRGPGREIPWGLFLFNRGMWIVACGVPSLLGAFHKGQSGSRTITVLAAVVLLLLLNTALMAVSVHPRMGGRLRAGLRGALAGQCVAFVALPLLGILI